MLNFITKFSENATVSIVSSQAALVILTVFGGGVFISWRDCPDYWRWLQELSVFTQASRAAIMDVSDHIDYFCELSTGGICIGPLGDQFPCDYSLPYSTSSCYVSGRDVLQLTQGTIVDESKWVPFGYLVLIFASFRLGLLILMYYPPKKILFDIRDWFTGEFSRGILESLMGLRRVEREFHAYTKMVSSSINVDENQPLKSDAGNTLSSTESDRGASSRRHHHRNAIEADALFQDRPPEVSTIVASESSPCLQWSNLSVTLAKKGTVLIDDVSGVAQSGRILALMGPSGAG
jgi:ABC-type multidrug transport system fused ATPase/permease subunit